MKQWPVAGAIIALIVTATAAISQAPLPEPVLDQITVLHIHDLGNSAHPLQLSVTQASLLIRGDSEYRDNAGNVKYCTFPADILLEQITKIEAKRGTAAFLGVVKLTKLHVEYNDEEGKHHDYDFLSQDAIQNYGAWHEGPAGGSNLLRFAQVAQNAVTARVEELKHPFPAVKEGSVILADTFTDRQYGGQLIGETRLYPATVHAPTSTDPNTLLIASKESFGDDSIPLGDILEVDIKQRPFIFIPKDPGTIIINLGIPNAPKIYVLSLKVRSEGAKATTYRIVSDEAVCIDNVPCKEGADNGQHALDLARRIKSMIAARQKP